MATNDFSIRVNDIPEVIKAFYGAGRTPYFRSQPGIGKTDMVRAAAASLTAWLTSIGDKHTEVGVIEVHLASMSEVDVRGYMIPDGKESVFTRPPFFREMEAHPRGILFFDEFPQAPPEVQKAVAPALLDHTLGGHPIPSGWMVVCAGNRTEDNAGANDMLSHVINRMCLIDVKASEPDEWIEWAANHGIAPELMALAKIRPDVIFSAPDLSVSDTPYCTPRSVHALSDVANRWPNGLAGMVKTGPGRSVIRGFVGQGAASEIYGIMTMAVNLPQLDQIVADPKGTPVMKKPDEAYACLMMVAMRAKVEQKDQVVEYITRYDPNFALVGIAALLDRDVEFSNKGIGQWVRDNATLTAKLSRHLRGRKSNG